MKLSVSIPDNDVAFIDRYVAEHRVESRSAVLHRALSLLRASELGEQYAAAWDETEDEAAEWDSTIGDGIDTKPTS